MKTNATRLLDKLGIHYELRIYEVDPGVDLSALSAQTVAAKIALPLEQVFKTLVLRGDRTGHLFAVIPGNTEADEKAIAKLSGNRRVQMVPLKEVQPLTGYIRGGVTVFAATRAFPVFLDETAELFDLISISAGARGIQILLDPADYIRAASATIGALC